MNTETKNLTRWLRERILNRRKDLASKRKELIHEEHGLEQLKKLYHLLITTPEEGE